MKGMDESTLVEVGESGEVLLIMRHNDEKTKGKAVARSTDGGTTWGPVTYDSTLVGPVCEGAAANIGPDIFFSNPASSSSRNPLTIRRSSDGGHSWQGGFVIQEGLRGSSGYASLVRGAVGTEYGEGNTGGVLFEGSSAGTAGSITYRPFPLNLQPAPTPTPVPTPAPPPSPSASCTLTEGRDCSGEGDISFVGGVSSPHTCCEKCSQVSGCHVFIFRSERCYFKSSCASHITCSDCVSGVLNTPVPPPPTPVPPTPVPTPVPTPGKCTCGCTGADFEACVRGCPTDGLATCVSTCSGPCSSCTGGDDGSSLYDCVSSCPSDKFQECVSCCTDKFASII